MFDQNEIVDAAAIMVNEVRDFWISVRENTMITPELDLRIEKCIREFRLIGKTAVFFCGEVGVERLLEAVSNAGGDFLTAQLMLDGIPD